jgi:CheY-like chemotaxis protein
MQTTNTPNPIRILIVEDNPHDAELLQRQLKRASLDEHVLHLSDPREAVSLLRGPKRPQLLKTLLAIFLDVHLPYMSGIELLEIIRTMEGMADFPVVVMTSSPHPDTVEACKRLNVAGFVEKPVTFKDFSRIVAVFFHRPASSFVPGHQQVEREEWIGCRPSQSR